jgi:2-keto-3-deoxy-L-fuconate dehydrogenase
MGALDTKRVAVVGSAGPLGDATVATFEREGAVVAKADARADGDATSAVEQAIAALGGLDVLVNLTAPGEAPKPAADVDRDDWERVVKATVRAARTSNQAAFRHMSTHGGGLILNRADQSAELGMPGQALASAAAQAVVALSNASAGAWRGSGVRINVFQPSFGADPVTSVVPTLVFLASGSAALHGRTVPC